MDVIYVCPLSPDDVPILNVVWFAPLAVTFVMAVVVFLRHGQPPTPPSKSEDIFANGPKMPYLQK